ncbi:MULTISPECIES: hypothetical protein [Candidatus Williamhamiltonella]|nr:hypothetical protein [Candidatus Hamiltonella defensa]
MSYCLNFWTDNSLRMIRNWTESQIKIIEALSMPLARFTPA